MKLWPKHDCIITQSTAPRRLMSVARNTMSSPIKMEHTDKDVDQQAAMLTNAIRTKETYDYYNH